MCVSAGSPAILGIIVYSPVRLFAEGVAAYFDARPETRAVACTRLDAVQRALDAGAIRVLLLDVTERSILSEGRRLAQQFPDLRVIALALPEVADEVIACADHGFASYVPRNACVEDMLEVVQRALREEVICDPKVSGSLLRELRRRREAAPPPDDAGDELTRREREVLRLLGRRMSNKEIARQLCLSTATVKNHVHAILAKLKVHGRHEVMRRLESSRGW